MLLVYAGLRLSELVALDLDDARVSGRKAVVVVRSGKGDVYREVPLNAPARKALDDWLKQRPAPAVRIGGEPLFVSRAGGRLSARSVDDVVRKLGRAAGLELSAHVLRHTWVTRLVRAGNDVVLIWRSVCQVSSVECPPRCCRLGVGETCCSGGEASGEVLDVGQSHMRGLATPGPWLRRWLTRV